jgi:hypothetical protein
MNPGSTGGEVLDIGALEAAASAYAATFAAGQPYRHIVIDDFLSTDMAHAAARAFPPIDLMQRRHAGLAEARSLERRFDRVDTVFREILRELRSPAFLSWLETVTGIGGLQIGPPGDEAILLQAQSGDHHDIHADENWNARTGLYQRVNLLIYLTEDWNTAWDGALELWNAKMSACEQRVEPLFNRCLLMEVHDRAFHGYSRLQLPAGVTRKTIACWYYATTPAPLQSTHPHRVLFRDRPNESLTTRVQHLIRSAVEWLRTLRA